MAPHPGHLRRGGAYIALSPGLHVAAAGCNFARDDLFALRLSKPLGVTRIDGAGQAHDFATLPGVDSLNGIAFDVTGRFGHRLLVTGPAHGHTVVGAISCTGASTQLTDSAPTIEGGLAVAPAGFGAFAGDLIAPDELSGRILAIGTDGSARTVADSGLPHGGDIGVEGAGFVPPGFHAGGTAYFADRVTANNPHPGTDSLLRLGAAALAGAGVQDGDLLLATEGGALTIAVRCGASCTVSPVAAGPAVAHGEGHLILIADHAAPQATLSAAATLGRPSVGPGTVALAVAAGVVGVAVLGLLALRVRRR